MREQLNENSIQTQYDITMPSEQLYIDFKKKWGSNENISNWDDVNCSFSVDY